MTATEARPAAVALPRTRAAADGDWLAGRGPYRRAQVLAGAGVGLLVALLAWYFRTGIIPTDPWQYVQSALNFPSSRWVPLGFTRYGMILPLLPLVAVFGNAEATYYVMPLLGSALLGTSITLLAVRFWGRSGAVLALILALSSPIVFLNLSRGYPDVQSTGVSTLALVLALHARDRQGRTGRSSTALLLGIGFLLGWAFEARETTVFIWPLAVLVLLWRRPDRRRSLLLVAAAMAVWALADLAIGLFGYGDALMRVHAFTRQDLAATTNPADLAVQSTFVGRDRSFYLTVVPRLLTGVVGGWWTLAIGAVGLLGLFSRRGGTRFAAICLAVTFLGFVGITGFFFPHHPSGRIDVQRYWVGFLPFAGLAATGVLSDLVDVLAPRARGRGFTRRAVALAMIVVSCLGPLVSLARDTAVNPAYVVNGANQLSLLRDQLASTYPAQPVRLYTDWYTQRLLPIYTRPSTGGDPLWQGEILSLTGRKAKPQPGDLVAINSLRDNSCAFCRRVINEWYAKRGPIPKTWQEVWATPKRNLVLYRVAG